MLAWAGFYLTLHRSTTQSRCPDGDGFPGPADLRARGDRRETMKTMLLAAAAVLGLGVGAAFANDGDGPIPNTLFTELPGVIAQDPVQQAPTALAGNQLGTTA